MTTWAPWLDDDTENYTYDFGIFFSYDHVEVYFFW